MIAVATTTADQINARLLNMPRQEISRQGTPSQPIESASAGTCMASAARPAAASRLPLPDRRPSVGQQHPPLGDFQHPGTEVFIQLDLGQALQGAVQGAQFLQQLPGLRAGGQDLLDADLLIGGQFAVEIRAEQFCVGNFVHTVFLTYLRLAVGLFGTFNASHSSTARTSFNCSRSCIRARCRRLRTVPTGKSRISAIVS